MKRTTLGEFEEIVLLVTASLEDEAYGVTVTQEIEQQTGRIVGFNTVHTTLQRLEEKGLSLLKWEVPRPNAVAEEKDTSL